MNNENKENMNDVNYINNVDDMNDVISQNIENLPKRSIADLATGDADLNSSDIPAIDLYLDQIISLIADKNLSASECYSERNLTKMMVNNYAKGGLIDPPNGKKYSKSHIVQMLLVNRLKNSLSMSEIKQFLDGVKSSDVCDVVNIYDAFIGKKNTLHDIASSVISSIAENDNDPSNVIALLALSDYFKNAAKLLIEQNYPTLTDKNDKEKEKDKDKDREKDKEKNKKDKENKKKNEQ